MITEPAQAENEFEVLCAWCGVKIRTDQTEESYRTCLECFYQIVTDQLNSQRQTNSSLMASDR
jgi:DNA-directed RNA polymerase subunit RPC12/RpoP